MKVLFLATMPRIEASTRYRVLQYFPALRGAGHVPSFSPFFGERAGWKVTRTARGFYSRAQDFARAGKYDVVVVHRELLPYSWNHGVRFLRGRAPLVFDFDDAVFLPSQRGWRRRIAAPGSSRLLVEAAAVVLAGNEYLAQYARQAHDRVEVVPTVVDTACYRPTETATSSVPLVGWVGSPSTARYLRPILPILDELARSFRFRLRIVGAGAPLRLDRVEVESPGWHADGEEELFRDLDIGLYPLRDDEWARGKCGFKAIQYMACGVASVSSPVGAVRDIVRDGIDGVWAEGASQWKDALAHLLTSPAGRARLGASGRERACKQYSLATATPRFLAALERAQQTK